MRCEGFVVACSKVWFLLVVRCFFFVLLGVCEVGWGGFQQAGVMMRLLLGSSASALTETERAASF